MPIKTIIQELESVKLITREGFKFAHPQLLGYPRCCGPGSGLLEELIPDAINGVPLSAACDIHDDCWANAEKSWNNFHMGNGIFLHNLVQLYLHFKDQMTPKDQLLTQQAILGYSFAVSTLGVPVYWGKF